VTSRENNFIFSISLKSPPPRGSGDAGSEHRRKMIGIVGLSRWNTIHFLLNPSHWGQGYCTESLKAFLPALLKRQPDREGISGAVLDGNTRSTRVLEKCGFELEKNPSGGRMSIDGVFHEMPRRLSKAEDEDLKRAVEALKVQSTSPIAAEKPKARRMIIYTYKFTRPQSVA
jgi:RimJ/RimL family protein N-acetyltransferase